MTSMNLERDRQHALNSPSVTTAGTAGETGTASTGTSASRLPFKRAEFGSPIRMAVSALFIAAGIGTPSPVFVGTEHGSQNMADASVNSQTKDDFSNGWLSLIYGQDAGISSDFAYTQANCILSDDGGAPAGVSIPQSPLKSGFRFSRNAFTASR
jgi:hypothetical protein